METKLSLKNFTANQTKKIIILLFFLLPVYIFSQETSPNYFFETQNGERRLRQRLTWKGGANTYRYEVVIEKNEDGFFVPYASESTSASFIIVSMLHGNYRFRVIPYDIFDIAGQPSEWKDLEVRQALVPALSEDQIFVMLDNVENPDGFFVYISGDSIHPEAEIFLSHPDNTRTVFDDITFDEDNNVSIYIDSSNLERGDYGIIIRNPGGFESETGKAILKEAVEQIAMIRELKKARDEAVIFNDKKETSLEAPKSELAIENEDEKIIPPKRVIKALNIGWCPFFGIYGIDLSSKENIFVNFSLKGRLPMDFFLGAEFGLSISALNASNMILNINLLMNRNLYKNKLFVGLKAGTGLLINNASNKDLYLEELYLYDSENNYESSVKVLLNIGLSFSWHIARIFSFDIGVNYLHFFGDIKSGSISPWIGIGFQF